MKFVVYNVKILHFNVSSPILCPDDMVKVCNACNGSLEAGPGREKVEVALREF